MKKILLAAMAIMLFACSSEDNTPVDNGNPDPVACTNVYIGDAILSTQAKVDAFVAAGYCSINGNLVIGTSVEGQFTDITNLSGLMGLTSVSGWLQIGNNTNLASLNGLQNIKVSKRIMVYSNNSLTNLQGFPDTVEGTAIFIQLNYGLTSLQGLKLKNMTDLRLTGLINLEYIDVPSDVTKLAAIQIIGCDKLTSLHGLEAMTEISGFWISGNESLVSLEGAENITRVQNLQIMSNNALESISHLSGITSIGYIPYAADYELFPHLMINANLSLKSLDGLENVSEYSGVIFQIEQNPKLSDFCALTTLLENQTLEQYEVLQNSYNPSQNNITSGSCSQP